MVPSDPSSQELRPTVRKSLDGCSVRRVTINIPDGFSNGHIRFSLAGDTDEMTTAIGFSSAPGTTPEEEAVIFADSFADTTLASAGAICALYTYKGVRVERMTTTGSVVTEIDVTVVGTGSGTCLPSNCALLVDKVTASGGRAYRGRMFFPPIYASEDLVDHNGFINPTTAAVLQTTMTSFRTAMVTNGIPPVLFHSNVALTPTLITSLRMQSQIATQRERMR